MKDLILGIDFGSENIYVSYLRNNIPQLVENDTGDYRTPAYILEKSSDSIIIGKNAKNKNGVN
ncbi:Hsp70 family protein [bacterium]|nr:Hsp70 family protein [bacterium]